MIVDGDVITELASVDRSDRLKLVHKVSISTFVTQSLSEDPMRFLRLTASSPVLGTPSANNEALRQGSVTVRLSQLP